MFYSRRKRDASQYEIRPEDVIVLHITALDDKETEIEFLLLDPTSTSPVPDSSFTTEELRSLIVKIDKTKLSFQLKSVGGVPVKWVVAKWLVHCLNSMYKLHCKTCRRLVACSSYPEFLQLLDNLSISSDCNKCVKIAFVATCHCETCCDLWKQLATSLRVDNKFLRINLQQVC